MRTSETVHRRRIWPVLVPVVLVVALAILWTGLWFYAASAAEDTITRWLEREAKVGRVYECGQRNIGGYPFRIEVRCSDPNVELRGVAPPVALKFAQLQTVWQIYQPTLVIGEFSGPLMIAESGRPADYVADWRLGQSSVRGTPMAPERASFVLDGLSLDRIGPDGQTNVLKAERGELHARIAEGSVTANPVLEMVLRLAAATAPDLHPFPATPLDGEIAARLRGLPDFAPKLWRVRLRELQARGGSIEITNARVRQGDVIAAATGTLGLTERGGLDGQLQLTVVNLEQALKALNLDQLMSQGRPGATVEALNRLVPGLGTLARQNAAPTVMAGLGAIGNRTVLDGRPALTVPLRFADGAVMLGPFPVGRVPPLF
jgi:hypothetical protein